MGVQVVNLARESVRRKPLCNGIRFEKCPIYSLGRRAQNTMEMDGTGRHGVLTFAVKKITKESPMIVRLEPQAG